VVAAFAFFVPHPTIAPDTTVGFFKWFAALAADSESQLNLFHKIILPIVAGISALSFSNTSVRAAQAQGAIQYDFRIWLIVFCIVIICMGIVIVVGMDMRSDEKDTSILTAVTNIKKYISTVSEYMGVYLMVLLGLKSQ
jgi:hypothetical protein